MKPSDDLEKVIKKDLNFTAGAELHDRILGDVLNAQEKSKKARSALDRPNLRRTIMKSPITKLAATAAVIAVVVLGLFEFFGTESKSGVLWAEVLKQTEQIPALTFDMTVEIAYPEGKKVMLPSKNYVAGDYGTRSDIFVDGKLLAIKYRLPNKKVAYQVRPDQKKYWRFDLSDEEAARGRDTDDPRTWLKMILSGDYTKLGRATINGVTAEGIECKRPDMVGKDGVLRLWVDVETNLPVQIVSEMIGMAEGQMRPHKYVMENFEWNASLDESLFEPNIPDDYTQGEDPRAGRDRQESSTAQQDAPQALTEQEQALQSKVKEAVRRFFNACTEQDWDTVSKYLPYMKISQRIKDINAGLETMYIGEPSRAANNNWLVPYEIKFKSGGTQKNTIELKEDENTGQFIVLGGF
jgi:outer membrane lipoprotein-sorting protein